MTARRRSSGGEPASGTRPLSRRTAVPLAAFAVLALAILTEFCGDVLTRQPIEFDAAATAFLHGFATPALDTLMRTVTEFGSTPIVGGVFAAAIILLWSKRLRLEAVWLAVVTAGSILLNQALKVAFHRPRPQLPWAPPAAEYSFPSGHAMNSLAIYVALAVIVWMVWGPKRGSIAVAMAAILAALIGLSRVYLGFHFLSDIVAGYLVAGLWLLSVAAFFVALKPDHLYQRRGWGRSRSRRTESFTTGNDT